MRTRQPDGAVRLTPPRIRWSAACTAGAFEAYSAEQRKELSRAAGWLECARGTDEAPGEPELSRPIARATATQLEKHVRAACVAVP